jgi:hypothetical protein
MRPLVLVISNAIQVEILLGGLRKHMKASKDLQGIQVSGHTAILIKDVPNGLAKDAVGERLDLASNPL